MRKKLNKKTATTPQGDLVDRELVAGLTDLGPYVQEIEHFGQVALQARGLDAGPVPVLVKLPATVDRPVVLVATEHGQILFDVENVVVGEVVEDQGEGVRQATAVAGLGHRG